MGLTFSSRATGTSKRFTLQEPGLNNFKSSIAAHASQDIRVERIDERRMRVRIRRGGQETRVICDESGPWVTRGLAPLVIVRDICPRAGVRAVGDQEQAPTAP
jgi:hypothetical protein